MTTTAHPPTELETPPRRPAWRSPRFLSGVAVGAVAAAVVAVVAVGVSGRGDDSTTRGSGTPAQQVRALSAFTAVDLAGTGQVTVAPGPSQKVVVHADDNLIDRVVTEVRAGVLVVSERGSFTTRSPMTVAVTVPTVRSATLSGTGDLTVTGVAAASFTADLSGTGTFTASGTAGRLDASLGGDGSLLLAALRADDVTVTLDGTGTATVHAAASLDATLSGTGTILYAGAPAHVTKDLSGTGTITPT